MTTSSSTHTTRRIRPISGATILLLIAAACGDDGGATFTADGVAAGGSGFCATMTQAMVIAEESSDDPDEIQQAIDLYRSAQAMLPDSAPESATAMIESAIVVGEAGLQLALEGGEISDILRDPEAFEAIQAVERLDVEEFVAWVDTECSGAEGVDQSIIDELVAESDRTGELLAGSSTAGGVDTALDDMTDMGDTTDPTDAGDGSPTTIPKTRDELATDGAPGNYRDTIVQVESAAALNHSPEAYMADVAAEPDDYYLAVTIYAETDSVANQFQPEDFTLIGPDGRPNRAFTVTDLGGNVLMSVALDARDSDTFVMVFETDELIDDLTDWELRLERRGRVGEQLPFTGTVDQPYPIALSEPAPSTVVIDSVIESCESAAVELAVSEPRISLEENDSNDLDRVLLDTRFVAMTVTATNTQAPFTGSCVSTIPIFQYEFRLEADGRPVASSYPTQEFSYLEPGTSRVLEQIFEIPATATDLRLLGAGGDVIGEWEISAPPAPGE